MDVMTAAFLTDHNELFEFACKFISRTELIIKMSLKQRLGRNWKRRSLSLPSRCWIMPCSKIKNLPKKYEIYKISYFWNGRNRLGERKKIGVEICSLKVKNHESYRGVARITMSQNCRSDTHWFFLQLWRPQKRAPSNFAFQAC